jgi:hypothetical protein
LGFQLVILLGNQLDYLLVPLLDYQLVTQSVIPQEIQLEALLVVQ